jgi:hypothetical protein
VIVTTKAAPSLPCMAGRLPLESQVGNPGPSGYVGLG